MGAGTGFHHEKPVVRRAHAFLRDGRSVTRGHGARLALRLGKAAPAPLPTLRPLLRSSTNADPKRRGKMFWKLISSVAALAFAVTAADAAQVTFYQLPSGAYPHDVS